MADIAIVGGGIAGLGAAYALRDAALDATVFERRGEVSGRATTRDLGGCVYDTGANYVKGGDDWLDHLLTEELDADGLVEAEGPVWTFDADGTISEGRDDDAPKWTYRAGVAELGRRLLDRSDASLRASTEVKRLEREGDEWRLHASDDRDLGAFDALVLTPPAPRTADLLAGADWDDDRRFDLADAVAVPYRPIVSVVLHYPFELDVPYYALVAEDREHDVGWLSREECKPGHVPAGESLLVLQFSPAWSAEQFEADAAPVTVAATERAAALLDDDRLASPDWTDGDRWRDALPDEAADSERLRPVESEGLFFAGDWVAGEGRVAAALRSGLDAGERVTARFS